MISKYNKPTKAQKQWMADVAALGSIISGGPAQIHHCVGRAGSHNKVKIGHWWVIPLTPAEHRAIHVAADRKMQEKQLFTTVCWHYIFSKHESGLAALPFDDTVVNAIQDYHL